MRFASGNKTTNRDYLPFEKVGVDIWSHNTPSVRRFLHLIGFTCYRASYLVLYLMHTKDEAVHKADQFLRWTMSQNRHVHFMRCDSDPIFKGEAYAAVAADYNVKLSYSTPYTPTQNTMAERRWGMVAPASHATHNATAVELLGIRNVGSVLLT